MITPARIVELLHRSPFWPIRVFLLDGSQHDIPHPEFAWVFGGQLFIGEPANGSPNADRRLNELAILHVTRVEELEPRRRKK